MRSSAGDVLALEPILRGGPGTELLGLAKYYLRRAGDEGHEQTDFEIDVIDEGVAWTENVSWIKNEIYRVYAQEFGERGGAWPARFNTSAYTLKFSDLDAFGNLTSIFKRDVFVLNFVSEVYNLGEVSHLLQKMVSGCPDDAHFLFVDRSDTKTTAEVNELVTNLKLALPDRHPPPQEASRGIINRTGTAAVIALASR
jgi:hypothetical protein